MTRLVPESEENRMERFSRNLLRFGHPRSRYILRREKDGFLEGRIVQDGAEVDGIPKGERTAPQLVHKGNRSRSYCGIYLGPYLYIPFFTIINLLIIISVHIYYFTGDRCPANGCELNQFNYRAMINSPLILKPKIYNSAELWRLWTYQFLHSGLEHIIGNCVVLLILGLILELIHGPVRIAIIYTTGVITGGILALCVTPCQSLVGASGGCYALMASFIANGIMNMDVMDLLVKLLHFLPISIFMVFDVGYTVYMELHASGYQVSWAAHLGGAISGLVIGIVTLKNFEKLPYEKTLQWVSTICFAVFFLSMAGYLLAIGSENPCGIGTKNYEFHKESGLISDFYG
ncbi:Oidioi.mRNA.OKI2018_I69.chr1.g132.t1.cds [Oikopleura dioica]|uniref:rhomboid protease n=1 Tax=Oikopleura dioica TaxID=34765 RepID=A0ABN7SQ67_OIKDI|nr:Oidioi.mRNA.OKI2018_I69.chr1.g132.t1.cds [Oikopleura dioica]